MLIYHPGGASGVCMGVLHAAGTQVDARAARGTGARGYLHIELFRELCSLHSHLLGWA